MVRPISCQVCGTRISQARTGRPRFYCSDVCRMRSQRLRAFTVHVDQDRVEVPPVEVRQAETVDQVERAILEARAVAFALVRLGRSAQPNLAHRCAKTGEAILAALNEHFGRIL